MHLLERVRLGNDVEALVRGQQQRALAWEDRVRAVVLMVWGGHRMWFPSGSRKQRARSPTALATPPAQRIVSHLVAPRR